MVIFKIINTKNGKAYYNLALNGYSFAAKVRDILYGQNQRFKIYYPVYDDIKQGDRFEIVVCEFNTPPEQINSRMIELLSKDTNNYNGEWVPLYNNTIKQHYKEVTLWNKEQGQELYLSLVDLFGEEMLTTIVFDYLYCYANEEWLKKIFKLTDLELGIILKGLPTYINLMNFSLANTSLSQTTKRKWRGNNNGLYTVNKSQQRVRVSDNLE